MATSKEIKDGYTSTLQDLTCNSKPLISVLTMLAEENVAHAKDIVEAIEAHLSKVRSDVKLPVLYLIDCIIKNVGGPYTTSFCSNIVPLFCSVFQLVDEKTRAEMYKLRQTWNDVLPKSKLYALDVQTNQMDHAWPITAAPPNIHFNPKFLKTTSAISNKKEAALVPKPMNVPSADDSATLDMKQRLIVKQKELLDLQQKKVELELLQAQVKLQEQQLKKTTTGHDSISKNILLKPGVAKQLLEESSELTKNRILLNQKQTNNLNIGHTMPKIAPVVNNALISAVSRDPRLRRQQAAQQSTVINSNNQLENKGNAANSIEIKIVSNKMGIRNDRTDARFVNNKDELPKKLSRIPLKSRRSSSPNSKSAKGSRVAKSTSGSGSTSSLESPTKNSKSSRSSSKSPTKYKKGSSNSTIRSENKKGAKSKGDRETFKDVKGTKTRNYMRRNRDLSISPEGDSSDHHDVDLRVGGPPEKLPRLQSDSNDEKYVDIDLRNTPAVVGKKRTSTETPETPILKKSKAEVFDVLFGNEDVDLRKLPPISSPKEADRPPTPPAPIISDKPTKPKNSNEKENTASSNGSPKKDVSKSNLDALRAKLANATNKEKFNKSRFNLQVEQKKSQLENKSAPIAESRNKIIISPADEESIKSGNMTIAQGNALMNKLIAHVENNKLKEAQKKEMEENISLQEISDDELSDEDDSVEIVEPDNNRNERLHGQQDDYPKHGNRTRSKRGHMPPWRSHRLPIIPTKSAIEPWIRPVPAPQWRPPFNFQMKLEDHNTDAIEAKSNSPFHNTNDSQDLVVNCSNQDNTKSINIDGEPRDIIYYEDTAIAFMTWEDPREITFQNGQRRITFDEKDNFLLSFNEPYSEVVINGNLHKIRLGAPTREIWIDGKSYECFFGGAGITIDLNGKLTTVKIEGPPPQVKIGTTRRTDLVAGKINLIIDAKTIVPVYLDAKTQKFDIDGQIHTLKFTDALQTVLINDVPFKVEFGGLPKPITVHGKKHFVRFSVLPRGIKPGYTKIKNMEGVVLERSDNENSQEGFEPPPVETPVTAPVVPVMTRKKTRFSDDSPERFSNSSPNTLQNLLQPNFGIDILSNVLAATASLQPINQSVSNYQVENIAKPHMIPPAIEIHPMVPMVPPPILPTSININDLFQKLVATGIVTSTAKEVQPIAPPPVIPEVIEPEPAPVKIRKHDMVLKYVDFNKPHTLKVRQPALIHALYSGMQCSSCGMRFPPENSILYSQHLDWHFRQNRKGKKNIRKATSRRWYYSIADWNNYEEIEDLEEREKCYFENQQLEQAQGGNEEGEEEIEIPSVPADSNVPDAQCEVCQERFEQYYNEEREEWHLRMAIRIDEHTYHPLCYEDYQASLVDVTLDESSIQLKSIGNGIPGLEVPLEEPSDKDDTLEIIIDDGESGESGANTPKQDPDAQIVDIEETKNLDEDDDDVIINEIQPERIILDEYEFKGNVDEDLIGVVIKQEPMDDGFMDVENFKLGEIKIKNEPVTPDESFEDIGLITQEADKTKPAVSSDTTHAELVTTIDGNVELNSGAPPASGISGKIKINISKQLPVIAPKENKDISLDVDNNIEPLDPTQPLPPGEEPVQLNLKPALQGIDLKKLPPVNKGSELTGLCSIM